MKCLLLLFLSLVSISCVSTKIDFEKQYQETLNLINSNSYRIEINTVLPFNTVVSSQVINKLFFGTPNNASRIDVEGDRFFIAINGQKSSAILPYFGERRLPGNFNESGIEFDNYFNDYKLNEHPKKKFITINYKINKNSENFIIIIKIFPNRKVSVSINSSHLSTINYEGVIID